ncbi:flagellar hook-basal body protein [Bacillus sp. FJAT-27251]|uniref:flagellar hook-basal body protein n=1 Tax=Bacillus sp. FJAT-27251 TaxID=1684142 RepID=UPI0006A79556|nr:flagellar hook-basal body protein [Bacillus sp. FJAT-27251]
MSIQFHSAATTMRELQKKVDTIANNISNVNTTGYKRREASFSDTLVHSIERQAGPQHELGRNTPLGLRVGSGAKMAQTILRSEQGSVLKTDRPLDFMIEGSSGFFRVDAGGGVQYTRDGSFQLQPVLNSGQVRLTTSSGNSVLGNNNLPIIFDGDYDTIKADANGTIQVTFKDSAKPAAEFQLSVARVNRPGILEKTGSNLFQLPGDEAEQIASGTLQVINLAQGNDGSITVKQGALEASNVDMGEEMTELVATQRLIQSQGRAISFGDDMMGLVNTIRG